MGEPTQEPNSSHGMKRKRSPFNEDAAPTPKSNRVAQPQINYLSRLYDDELPLPTSRSSLVELLRLLKDYHAVLDRHESLAANVGARPLSLVLMSRFERLFEGPPKVLKSFAAKEHGIISWLDVVEFARNNPDQFTLSHMSDGHRICQFYTKQCSVQISEEDYLLIRSGAPQKLIPPQPIAEDEENELGSLEIIHKAVHSIHNSADQVAVCSRELIYKLIRRRETVMESRSIHTSISSAQAIRAASPSNVALINVGGAYSSESHLKSGTPTSTGFVPVNAPWPKNEVDPARTELGTSGATGDVSKSTHEDLRQKFASIAGQNLQDINPNGHLELEAAAHTTPRKTGIASNAKGKNRQSQEKNAASTLPHHLAAASSPDGLKSALGPSNGRSSNTNRDDGGPFKAEMVARLEKLPKGELITPPCDRCRRLRIDCLKNLTACIGCTRKHAKCAWKNVRADELRETPDTSMTSSPIRPKTEVSGSLKLDTPQTERTTSSYDRSPPPHAQMPISQYPQQHKAHHQIQAQESRHGRSTSSDSNNQLPPLPPLPLPPLPLPSSREANHFASSIPQRTQRDKGAPLERATRTTPTYQEHQQDISAATSSQQPHSYHPHTPRYSPISRSKADTPKLVGEIEPAGAASSSISSNWAPSSRCSNDSTLNPVDSRPVSSTSLNPPKIEKKTRTSVNSLVQ